LKIEIESVNNGYIIVMPKNEYEGTNVERKIVIQEKEDDLERTNILEFQAFNDLVQYLQEIFCISNSKHNEIGYITGLCSEYERWDIQETMQESLLNPKNDLGD